MAVRQIVQQSRALLSSGKLKEISLQVPWGDVKGFEMGPVDAPPVLMFHGWLDNCYSFVPLLTHLPLNRRYIALDLPGHGHSSHKPIFAYNFLLSAVSDIEFIRRSLGIEKFSMIGHSFGGILSLLYSATYPDFIEKTITIDGIFPTFGAKSEVVNRLRRAIDEHAENTFAQRFYKDADALSEAKTNSHWYSGLDKTLTDLIVERGSESTGEGVKQRYDTKVRYGSLMYLPKGHYEEFLKALKKPTLFIGGESGGILLYKKSMEGRINKAAEGVKTIDDVFAVNDVMSYIIIPGPHHVHMSTPHTTADLVTTFLDKGTIARENQ